MRHLKLRWLCSLLVVMGIGGLGLVSKNVSASPIREGYVPAVWFVTPAGAVVGNASYGSLNNVHLNRPIVDIASTTDGKGYWLVASDGGVFGFGDAQFYGSTGNIALNQPIVGMASTPDGAGYWLVAGDGGVFSFGDAHFYGSTGNIALNQPIVGMASTPDGGGYWLVAADGGVFGIGDAGFYGSAASLHPNKPITGVAPTADGKGYWLESGDGGVFTYGDAAFYGSAAGPGVAFSTIGSPMISPDGQGYWLATPQTAAACLRYGDVIPPGGSQSGSISCISGAGSPPSSNAPAIYVGAATAFYQRMPIPTS
jgi:hypothetical protein